MTIGFLPYNSGDSSVIIEVPLTTEPTNEEMGADNNGNDVGGSTFDANGFKANADGFMRYLGMETILAGMENQGQMGMDLESVWHGMDDNDAGSFGDSLAGAQTVLCMVSTLDDIFLAKRDAGAVGQSRAEVTGQNIQTRPIRTWDEGSETTEVNLPRYSTFNRGTIIRWSLGWNEDPDNTSNLLFWQGIDGIPYSFQSIPKTAIGTLGSNLWICANQSGGQLLPDHYVKNLTISNEGPEFTTGRTIMLIGDSQARSHSISNRNNYDSLQGYHMIKSLQDKGEYLDPRQIVIERFPGYPVENKGGNYIGAEIPAAIARHTPRTDYVYIAATNDAIGASFDEAQFTTDLQSDIDALKAAPGFERLALVNVRSFIADTSEDTPEARTRRDTIINPIMLASGENVVDAYNLLGAEFPPNYTFIGSNINPDADFHIAANGNLLEGIDYIRALDGETIRSQLTAVGSIRVNTTIDNELGVPITPIGGLSASIIGISTNPKSAGVVLSEDQTEDHVSQTIGGLNAGGVEGVDFESVVGASINNENKHIRFETAVTPVAPDGEFPNTYLNKTEPPVTVNTDESVFSVQP